MFHDFASNFIFSVRLFFLPLGFVYLLPTCRCFAYFHGDRHGGYYQFLISCIIGVKGYKRRKSRQRRTSDRATLADVFAAKVCWLAVLRKYSSSLKFLSIPVMKGLYSKH